MCCRPIRQRSTARLVPQSAYFLVWIGVFVSGPGMEATYVHIGELSTRSVAGIFRGGVGVSGQPGGFGVRRPGASQSKAQEEGERTYAVKARY